tara:strand:+ start:515 stop:712 length:198 start_codon:yes stop_codon:yes gene_type:complete
MRFSEYENMKKVESNEIKSIRIILEQYGVSDNDGLVNYVHAILQDNDRMRKRIIQINNLTKGYKV